MSDAGDPMELAMRFPAMLNNRSGMKRREIAYELARWFAVFLAIAIAFMGLLYLLIYTG
ncbi:MAG: hypothetical protein U1E81_08360 [Xanthobacteraceae bacterium]